MTHHGQKVPKSHTDSPVSSPKESVDFELEIGIDESWRVLAIVRRSWSGSVLSPPPFNPAEIPAFLAGVRSQRPLSANF
jgi:hypothetical protein